MARTARYDEHEIKIALELVTRAKTLQELRQGQSILLPVLTGATLDTTAEILGLSRDRVCVLRRRFSVLAETSNITIREKRGGRRRELMSIEEEKAFLAPWIEKAEAGGVLVGTSNPLGIPGDRWPRSSKVDGLSSIGSTWVAKGNA